jgi:hypothetical protein
MQIAGILNSRKVKVEMISDDPENPLVLSATKDSKPVPLIQSWTRGAADFWQKRSGQTDWCSGKGLVLEIKANEAQPEDWCSRKLSALGNGEKT